MSSRPQDRPLEDFKQGNDTVSFQEGLPRLSGEGGPGGGRQVAGEQGGCEDAGEDGSK